MNRLFASLLIAALALGRTGPATASEGGRDGEDPIVTEVNRIALAITMNQIFFTPSQFIFLSPGGAFGMAPDDVEMVEEPGGGGLFAKLFEANKRRVFEELARQNFLNKIGRAYRIGDMVFVDSMFYDGELGDEATAEGLEALAFILGGGLFALGPARNPFDTLLEQQIIAMLFFMRASGGTRVVYTLEPTLSEAYGIDGAKVGAVVHYPPALLAFVAALITGQAEFLGDVWQIGDKVVVSAPLHEVFDIEEEARE